MEVFTYGGGTYLIDIFNAVAALAGSGAIESLIRLALALGLAFVLVRLVFQPDTLSLMRWFLSALLIYGIMFVPKIDVHITDRLNPALPAATVANVPWGLGYFAGLSSQVGDFVTRKTEAAYSLPGDLLYSRNGMIFGAKLLEATTSFRVTDTEFAANLTGFVQQCVFYSLLLGQLDLEEMKRANNIWAYLTVQNTPSPARSFLYRDAGAETVVTCLDGATRLTARWDSELDRAAELFGVRLYPDRTPAIAKAAILSDLPIAHQYLVGTSKEALGIIQQTMMINAIDRSARDFGGGTGSVSALELYAQARAESQATSTLSAVARQAEKWVPLLRIVLETLYYGLFPFVFPLLLLPALGRTLFGAYFGAFLWLQSWGPAYVILHRIMMGEAATRTQAAAFQGPSERGLSLVTMNGIEAVNTDVALLAGFFLILVPFLTAALARGAVAIGSLSQSILAPIQSSAAAAAGEAATGNISLGNTALDTHRFNQTSAHSFSTSPSVESGVFSYRTPEGATVSMTPDGRQVVQGGGAHSSFPASLNYGQSISETLSNRAASAREQGQSLQAQSRQSFATVNQQIADLAHGVSEGKTVQEMTGLNADSRVTENTSKLLDHARTFALQNQTSSQTALNAFASASAGVKVSAPGIVDLFSPVDAEASIRGGAEGTARVASQELFSEAQDYAERHNLGQLFDDTRSALMHQSATESGGETSQFRSVMAQNLNQAQSFEETSSRSFSTAERFEDAQISQARESADFNQRLDQTFFEYLAGQRSDSGTPFGPSEARRLLVSQNPADQAVVRSHKGDFVDQYVDENFGPGHTIDVQEPSAASVSAGRSEGIAAVRNTFEENSAAIAADAPDPPVAERAADIGSSAASVREEAAGALEPGRAVQPGASHAKEQISKEAVKGAFDKAVSSTPGDLREWTRHNQPPSPGQGSAPSMRRRRSRRRPLPEGPSADDDGEDNAQ